MHLATGVKTRFTSVGFLRAKLFRLTAFAGIIYEKLEQVAC